jgi:hypothetical protein
MPRTAHVVARSPPVSHLSTSLCREDWWHGMFLLLQMFESTGWLLEEFDMIFPTVVRPPNSPSVLQGVDDIEVSQPCEVVVLCQQTFPFCSSSDFSLSPLYFHWTILVSWNHLKHGSWLMLHCVCVLQPPLKIGILWHFPLSSNLQRMSVITRTLRVTQFQVYCKGSPEMILSLCQPDTGVWSLCSCCRSFSMLMCAPCPEPVQKAHIITVCFFLIFCGTVVLPMAKSPKWPDILMSFYQSVMYISFFYHAWYVSGACISGAGTLTCYSADEPELCVRGVKAERLPCFGIGIQRAASCKRCRGAAPLEGGCGVESQIFGTYYHGEQTEARNHWHHWHAAQCQH